MSELERSFRSELFEIPNFMFYLYATRDRWTFSCNCVFSSNLTSHEYYHLSASWIFWQLFVY